MLLTPLFGRLIKPLESQASDAFPVAPSPPELEPARQGQLASPHNRLIDEKATSTRAADHQKSVSAAASAASAARFTLAAVASFEIGR